MTNYECSCDSNIFLKGFSKGNLYVCTTRCIGPLKKNPNCTESMSSNIGSRSGFEKIILNAESQHYYCIL